mmetsp:Transcript_35132/g.52449  ORF Transcript_35132/g.52449 Transcript_35132/m.52449 type:complete len:341 (-) Transcript_35132:2107-3129(-)
MITPDSEGFSAFCMSALLKPSDAVFLQSSGRIAHSGISELFLSGKIPKPSVSSSGACNCFGGCPSCFGAQLRPFLGLSAKWEDIFLWRKDNAFEMCVKSSAVFSLFLTGELRGEVLGVIATTMSDKVGGLEIKCPNDSFSSISSCFSTSFSLSDSQLAVAFLLRALLRSAAAAAAELVPNRERLARPGVITGLLSSLRLKSILPGLTCDDPIVGSITSERDERLFLSDISVQRSEASSLVTDCVSVLFILSPGREFLRESDANDEPAVVERSFLAGKSLLRPTLSFFSCKDIFRGKVMHASLSGESISSSLVRSSTLSSGGSSTKDSLSEDISVSSILFP